MAAIWRSQAAVGPIPPLKEGLVVSPFGPDSTDVAPRMAPRGESARSCDPVSRVA